jgi:hypothetical protein
MTLQIAPAITELYDNAQGVVGNLISNPVATAIGGAVVGAGVATAVGAVVTSSGSSSPNRKRRSKIKHTSRGWKQDRKRRSKQKWELDYQRRKRKRKKSKRTSRRGVKYTKNGQPYIILKSGKARFIKRRK